MVDPAERTAQLLALVLDRAPRSVGELVGEVEVARYDVRAALDALERHGLVAFDERRAQVRPGPALVRFARRGQDLRELAAPVMRRLAAESGETVNVMVPTSGGAEAIVQAEGHHVLAASNWVGLEVPDHCSAAGKVFLALGVSSLPPGALEPRTRATITDRKRLAAELETVRERGYATISDELEVGLAAVAAPIRDAGGAVIAALSVAGPTARLTAPRLDVLGRLAIEQAYEIAAALGFDRRREDVLDALRSSPSIARTPGPAEP
jgi:IclR family transcriptional regulator, acetate operon repressor